MVNPKDLLEARERVGVPLLERMTATHPYFGMRTHSLAEAVKAAKVNLHGVGVGKKIVKGKPTDEACVRFYVVQKMASRLLMEDDVLPKHINGIPTDVIEASLAYFSNGNCCDNRREPQRPVRPGISAAHNQVTSGTLGGFCRSVAPGDDPDKIYALSNNHVFALNNTQTDGSLFQPSPAHEGTEANTFATLSRFVTIKTGPLSRNLVDAAIGEVLPEIATNFESCTIGRIAGVTPPLENMIVCKHGARTGYTEGIIFDELLDQDEVVHINPDNSFVIAKFQKQMRIHPIPPFQSFAAAGDSGSLVVKKDTKQVVGLVNAMGIGYTIANRIQDVMAELQIELL